jgi:SAM-dependent methyltransferase
LSEAQDYPLGYSEEEARRLADQGALLEKLTDDVLQRAGLGAGMEVLDIGGGVGDVSLLAARLVGNDGSVLGVDRSSLSVETARRRVASQGVRNVSFKEADIATFETNQKFDAIVGRLILLYRRIHLRYCDTYCDIFGQAASSFFRNTICHSSHRLPRRNCSCKLDDGFLRLLKPAALNWIWGRSFMRRSSVLDCPHRA